MSIPSSPPRGAPLAARYRPLHRLLGAVLGASLLAPLAATAAVTSPAPASALAATARTIKVTVSSDAGGSASVAANGSSSTTFTVTNTGSQSVSMNFVVTACSGSIASCSASPSGGTLVNPGDAMTVTAYFSGGPAAGSGTLTLAAKNASTGLQLSAATVNVTVTTPLNLPTISATPHLGDRLDVSQCVANCFETTFGAATPAYVSRDVPRSLAVQYRSNHAHPYGKVSLDVTDVAAPSGSSYKLQLTDPNGAYVTFTNGSTALYLARAASDPTRIVAEFDAASIPTSARLYTAYVTSVYPGGEQGTRSQAVRVMIVNDAANVAGAGVDFVGVQRLSSNQSGGAVVTDGSGSASFFSGNCTVSFACTFTSPAGDFSTLSTSGGLYHRIYPDGVDVAFNSAGQEISATDRFGSVTQLGYTWNAYANDNLLTSITDPTGQQIQLGYRDASNQYGYKLGSLAVVVTPGSRVTTFGVDGSNNLVSWIDVDGVTSGTYWFDGAHRMYQLADRNGGVWNYGYAYASTLASVDAPSVVVDGGATVRPHSSQAEPAAVLLQAAAAGSGTSTGTAIAAATATTLRASVTDPKSNTTYLTVNRFGLPTKVEAPLTNPSLAEYDANTGQLLRAVSPTGGVTKYVWSANKLTDFTDSLTGQNVHTDYETSYSLPKAVSGSGQPQWMKYDKTKAGWPLDSVVVGYYTNPATTYVTDAYGRTTQITDPVGHVSTFAFEPSGMQNMVTVTPGNGQSTTYGHDGYGRTTTATLPTGGILSVGFDVRNQQTWASSPAYNDTTRTQYDGLGNPTVVTDAKGQVYTTTRNVLGWAVRETDPTGHADSTAFDVAGNPVYALSRQGRQVRIQYDALGRVASKIGVTEHDTITYSYDQSARWTAARVVTRGALVTTDTIFADVMGRTTQEVTYRAGASSWNVTSSYDPGVGPRRSVTLYAGPGFVNSSAYTGFTYDGANRLSYMDGYAGHTNFTYNDDQQQDTVRFPSGLAEKTRYTAMHAIGDRGYNNSTVDGALHRWYQVDSLSRLKQRGINDAGQYQEFHYDIKGQLGSWQKRTPTAPATCHPSIYYGTDCGVPANPPTVDAAVYPTYDIVGNSTDAGGTPLTGNRMQAFNGFTMTYDYDGYLASKSSASTADTYDWDEFGQLAGVTRNGTVIATFRYDGFGRRAIKASATLGTIHYVWDGDQIEAEVDGSGNVLQSYSYYPGVDRPHSVTVGPQDVGATETYFTSIEQSGDVNGLIRASDNAVVAQYSYTPWGELETDMPTVGGVRVNSLRWKGLPYDIETGLYYVRARYFDPATRRFISEDPIGLGGGINQYAFAGNDPVNGSDPSGLKISVVAEGHCQLSYLANHPDDGTIDVSGCDFGGGGTGFIPPSLPEWGLPELSAPTPQQGPRGTGPSSAEPLSWLVQNVEFKGCPATIAGNVNLSLPTPRSAPGVVLFMMTRSGDIKEKSRAGGFPGPKWYTTAHYKGTAYGSAIPRGITIEAKIFCGLGMGFVYQVR